MSRPLRSNPKIRLNLDMPSVVKEQIESVRDRTNADSMGEVVRRAVALYDFVLLEQDKGAVVVVRDAADIEKQIHLV